VQQATKRLLSIDELSHHIGIGKGTLYNWVSQRKIEKIKFKEFAKMYLKVYAKLNKRAWTRDETSINNLNVIVALNTGMRKGEMLTLKWEDVDFRQKMIYFIK